MKINVPLSISFVISTGEDINSCITFSPKMPEARMFQNLYKRKVTVSFFRMNLNEPIRDRIQAIARDK